jgi:hypothetical protein
MSHRWGDVPPRHNSTLQRLPEQVVNLLPPLVEVLYKQ